MIDPMIQGQRDERGAQPKIWQTPFDTLIASYNRAVDARADPNCRIPLYKSFGNKDFLSHFQWQRVLYFSGKGSGVTETGKPIPGAECLVLVDVDCKHGVGSSDTARSFARWFSAIHPAFAHIYWEPSTNGNGRHGYFALQISGLNTDQTRELFDRMYSLFRSLGDQWNRLHPDQLISMCECMGKPPKKTFVGGKLVKIEGGSLAKLPRNIEFYRSDGDRDTFGWDEVSQVSPEDIREIEDTLSGQPSPTKVRTTAKKPVVLSLPTTKKVMGSCEGDIIPADDRLDTFLPFGTQITPHPLRPVPRLRLPNLDPVKARQELRSQPRIVATDVDAGIAVWILYHCSRHPHPTGAMPTARVKAIWDKLYQDGRVPKAWNDLRFALARNEMSRLGLLTWIDTRFAQHEAGEPSSEGKAARWSLHPEFMSRIDEATGMRPAKAQPARSSVASMIQTGSVSSEHVISYDFASILTINSIGDTSDSSKPENTLNRITTLAKSNSELLIQSDPVPVTRKSRGEKPGYDATVKRRAKGRTA